MGNRIYEALGVEIQRDMATPDRHGFYPRRCHEILLRDGGEQCQRRARVGLEPYCRQHARIRWMLNEGIDGCTAAPDCTGSVVHGTRTATGTTWYCKAHSAEKQHDDRIGQQGVRPCEVADCKELATYGIRTAQYIFRYCPTHAELGRTRHYDRHANLKSSYR